MNNYLSTIVKNYIKMTHQPLKDVLMFLSPDDINLKIESVNAESYDDTLDKSSRVSTGSYYTPHGLANRMVKIALIDYISQFMKSDFIVSDQEVDDVEKAVEILDHIKLVDIACGEGVFLIEAYHIFQELYHKLGVKRHPETIIKRFYGSDIQREPLEILNIKLRTLAPEISRVNLKLGDSILDNLFDETFDIVVGNPPYVGEKGNKDMFDRYKMLDEYEGRMDLFYFFLYRGHRLLNSKGMMCQITTNYWVTADSAKKLRSYFRENTYFHRLINLDECKMFKSAKGMHNLIFTVGNQKALVKLKTIKNVKLDLETLFTHDYKISQEKLFSDIGNILLYEHLDYFSILQKIRKGSHATLGDLATINQGIVSGADKVSQSILDKKLDKAIVDKYKIKKEDPIFVSNSKQLKTDLYKPFYKNSHIRNYRPKLDDKRYILYTSKVYKDDVVLDHLEKFRTLLSNRREALSGKIPWYSLQWPRQIDIFENEKIVVPQRAILNYFSYTEEAFYASADVYFITKGPLKLITGVMNSKLMYFWLYNRGKRKGKNLELYAKPLSQIPFPNLRDEDLQLINEMVNKILSGHDQRQIIEQVLYKHYKLTKEEIEIIEEIYPRSTYEEIPEIN